MNTTNLPLWFLQWWDFYGCHVDYLKEHPLVENGYLHFKNNFQPAPSERKFSSLLIFCTKFFVPWVCSWFFDYNLQNGHPVLIRKFIHPKDWGQPLHQPVSFPIQYRTSPQDFNTTYTYWDYQQAWFNAFLIQNQVVGFSSGGIPLQLSPKVQN
jgi:hypothetical protein